MTTTVTASTVGSRSSFDKTRAMRMFVSNSKASLERDGSQNRHKKSESVMSENSRQIGPEENDVAEVSKTGVRPWYYVLSLFRMSPCFKSLMI